MTQYISSSPEQTESIAKKFAEQLKLGNWVALCGDLGTGKTSFVRGVFEGLRGKKPFFVHSPTFTLINEYSTKLGSLYHLDLYRINQPQELDSLDLAELMASPGVGIIEWADKFPPLVSQCHYVVYFTREGDLRRIEITSKEVSKFFQGKSFLTG